MFRAKGGGMGGTLPAVPTETGAERDKRIAAEYGDWEASFKSDGFSDDGGFTSKELSAHFGINQRTVRKRLRNGVLAGKYIRGVGYRTNASGAMARVPVYKLAQTVRGKAR